MTKSILDVLSEVRAQLQPYFPDQLSPQFGYSTVWMLEARLRAEGIQATGLVEEALREGCGLMIEYLRQGGAVERPESLFQGLSCQALEGLLLEWRRSQASELLRLLEGDIGLESCRLDYDHRVLVQVRRAIDRLANPFRDFLACDLVETLPEEAIRERLNLDDHESYLQLKRLSLVALRREIERSLDI